MMLYTDAGRSRTHANNTTNFSSDTTPGHDGSVSSGPRCGLKQTRCPIGEHRTVAGVCGSEGACYRRSAWVRGTVEHFHLGRIGRIEPTRRGRSGGSGGWPRSAASSAHRSGARARRQAPRGSAALRRHQGHEPRIESRPFRSAPTAQNRGPRSDPGAGSLERVARARFPSSGWVDASHGVEPMAHSHSSFVRRTARRSSASCRASVVLPAPGKPQVRISRASLTTNPSSHALPIGARRFARSVQAEKLRSRSLQRTSARSVTASHRIVAVYRVMSGVSFSGGSAVVVSPSALVHRIGAALAGADVLRLIDPDYVAMLLSPSEGAARFAPLWIRHRTCRDHAGCWPIALGGPVSRAVAADATEVELDESGVEHCTSGFYVALGHNSDPAAICALWSGSERRLVPPT